MRFASIFGNTVRKSSRFSSATPAQGSGRNEGAIFKRGCHDADAGRFSTGSEPPGPAAQGRSRGRGCRVSAPGRQLAGDAGLPPSRQGEGRRPGKATRLAGRREARQGTREREGKENTAPAQAEAIAVTWCDSRAVTLIGRDFGPPKECQENR